jgi:hypothetical protein
MKQRVSRMPYALTWEQTGNTNTNNNNNNNMQPNAAESYNIETMHSVLHNSFWKTSSQKWKKEKEMVGCLSVFI